MSSRSVSVHDGPVSDSASGAAVTRAAPPSTRGGDDRLRRVAQVASDLAPRPLDQLRVLDLACYEGQFAIEFALQGAEVLGIEGREVNVARARQRAEELGLERLRFLRGDVRDLRRERHGGFDVVLCLGLLYHLDFPDVIRLLEQIAEVCDGLAIIDTHVNLGLSRTFHDRGREYRGRVYIEHSERASQVERERSRWASLDNTVSFWPTRASLINALIDAGFTSVYECEAPPVAEQPLDRRTFVAVKGAATRTQSDASDESDERSRSGRVPERRSRAKLLRNHAPGTNLLKRLMLDLEAVRPRRESTDYGPRSYGRRR
jgi:2-polyprenyl-3-methyl-5-hydroxy-6-metoxy-1,4-benzoquinol methylase